jgi:hypothetical protein
MDILGEGQRKYLFALTEDSSLRADSYLPRLHIIAETGLVRLVGASHGLGALASQSLA